MIVEGHVRAGRPVGDGPDFVHAEVILILAAGHSYREVRQRLDTNPGIQSRFMPPPIPVVQIAYDPISLKWRLTMLNLCGASFRPVFFLSKNSIPKK